MSRKKRAVSCRGNELFGTKYRQIGLFFYKNNIVQ